MIYDVAQQSQRDKIYLLVIYMGPYSKQEFHVRSNMCSNEDHLLRPNHQWEGVGAGLTTNTGMLYKLKMCMYNKKILPLWWKLNEFDSLAWSMEGLEVVSEYPYWNDSRRILKVLRVKSFLVKINDVSNSWSSYLTTPSNKTCITSCGSLPVCNIEMWYGIQETFVINSICSGVVFCQRSSKQSTVVLMYIWRPWYKFITSELHVKGTCTVKVCYTFLRSTLAWISSKVAMQCRHLRSDSPTPTLNPPIWCAATVSAKNNCSVPLKNILSPSTSSWMPLVCKQNQQIIHKMYMYVLWPTKTDREVLHISGERFKNTFKTIII